jgi:hypothetical protein
MRHHIQAHTRAEWKDLEWHVVSQKVGHRVAASSFTLTKEQATNRHVVARGLVDARRAVRQLVQAERNG